MLRLRVSLWGRWRLSITTRESTQASRMENLARCGVEVPRMYFVCESMIAEATPWRRSTRYESINWPMYINRYPVSSCDSGGMHLA